jgi:hypothetical protein
MGSLLSPVVANLFMEDIENIALIYSPLQPNLWNKFVDDTFVIWPHGCDRLDNFLFKNIGIPMEDEHLQ